MTTVVETPVVRRPVWHTVAIAMIIVVAVWFAIILLWDNPLYRKLNRWLGTETIPVAVLAPAPVMGPPVAKDSRLADVQKDVQHLGSNDAALQDSLTNLTIAVAGVQTDVTTLKQTQLTRQDVKATIAADRAEQADQAADCLKFWTYIKSACTRASRASYIQQELDTNPVSFKICRDEHWMKTGLWGPLGPIGMPYCRKPHNY